MTGKDKEPLQRITLHLGEDVEALLAARLMTRDDLLGVISLAENSGKKLINRVTGRSLAFYRPKAVFYWVEYAPADDGYRVFTVYSHRMVMKSSGSSAEWVKTGQTSDWQCNLCQAPLAVQTVRLQYMQSIFPIDLPACSSCDFILIPEDLATGKIAEAEQALEDK